MNALAARPVGPRIAALCSAGLALLMAAACARAACVDESTLPRANGQASESIAAPEPQQELRSLVHEAIQRSKAVGVARLLAEAAQQDTEEARAAKRLQASANAFIGPALANSAAVTESSPAQMRAGVTLSQLLFDGGRSDRVVDWRQQLAEAARFGQLNAEEQLALTTVSLALDRSRYRIQTQIYSQYVRKMGCLVEALEQIVAADKGRLSELVQARKSLQEAQISYTQTQSQVRQVEVRLRRLVGDGLPGVAGLSSLLLKVPDLAELQADAARAYEITGLAAQAAAMNQLARSIEASQSPQVSWSFGGSANAAVGGSMATPANRGAGLSAGLQITIPLMNPGNAPASDAARKRAQAAELARAEALESRRWRIAEVHEQALSSFDRARRVVAVLRDSDQVRNFTLQQWQQLGRRSLFDVMASESEHYNLRVAQVNALHDGQQLNALLESLSHGINQWVQ
jgi:outer membrane protein TolC